MTAWAADAQPPLELKVLVVAVGAVSAVLNIAALQGRYVTLQNTGANTIYFVFGDALTVADPAALSGATACMALEPGDQRDYRFGKGLAFERAGAPAPLPVSHIAHRTSAGASELRVSVA
jgi:hypothetical protein